jgi:hypothetical protein
VFSKQLRELWSIHPRLRLAFDPASLPDAADSVPVRIQTHLDVKALEYSRWGRHFVLFDALRMPSNCDEVDGKPEDDDDPFFCLLEDDRLITEVRVTTDRLLTPLASGENRNDVRLIIHVRTVILDASDIQAPMY